MYWANLFSRRRSDRRGFTLVELLVVIVILAVLAAIVLPKFTDSGRRSRESALKSDLKLIRNAITLFHTDTGYYPNALSDLAQTESGSTQVWDGTAAAAVNATNWHGPYLDSVPNDPVSGSAFTYDHATGKVSSSASGNGLDGTAYSAW